jgi:hypothetical protein
MANYTRFEIYLPVLFEKHGEVQTLTRKRLLKFISEVAAKYEGVTQAHPTGHPQYKGWWRDDQNRPFVIDHLTYLFLLVRVDYEQQAIAFFEAQQKKLQKSLNQAVILVLHYPVQTLGLLSAMPPVSEEEDDSRPTPDESFPVA